MSAVTDTAVSPLVRLQRSAVAYAGAKLRLDAIAASVREERDMVRSILALPDEPEPDAAQDRAQLLAVNREVVTGLDQDLAAAIATWRGTIFDLQDSAVAVVGICRPPGCRRTEAQLQLAAQAFAAAKADIDQHSGPFSGVIYASRIATWRGCLMDLDAAARAYASTAKPTEGEA
jgi:hypothetical protein